MLVYPEPKWKAEQGTAQVLDSRRNPQMRSPASGASARAMAVRARPRLQRGPKAMGPVSCTNCAVTSLVPPLPSEPGPPNNESHAAPLQKAPPNPHLWTLESFHKPRLLPNRCLFLMGCDSLPHPPFFPRDTDVCKTWDTDLRKSASIVHRIRDIF